jgi:hypothetical protein
MRLREEVNAMKTIDMMDSFLRSEQNMFHPAQFLRRIRAAIESNREFETGFNITGIELIDRKIRIYGYYGGEMMIDFSDFETRLLAYYEKYPYEFDEDFEMTEIPNFKIQLDDLIDKVKIDLNRFKNILVYCNESYSEYSFYTHIKDFSRAFITYSTLSSNDGKTVDLYTGDWTLEQNDDPEMVKVLPVEAISILRNYILERLKIFEHSLG